MERIFTIKLTNGSVFSARGDEAMELKVHDDCVIRRDFYMDLGKVIRCGDPAAKPTSRVATFRNRM